MNLKTKFGNTVVPQFDRLQTTLLDSKIQQTNNALYQTISNLIAEAQRYATNTDKTVAEIKKEIAALDLSTPDTPHPFLFL